MIFYKRDNNNKIKIKFNKNNKIKYNNHKNYNNLNKYNKKNKYNHNKIK